MGQHYIAQITVNEQNQRALDFYLRRSYKVHHRTPTDQQGRPYPAAVSDAVLLLTGASARRPAVWMQRRFNPARLGPGAQASGSTEPTGGPGSYRPRGAAPRGGCLPAASISPVRNGGKNTREEEFPPPWTHLLWFLEPGKVVFSFSYKLWTNARNSPPPGWAGWGGVGGQTAGKGQENPVKKHSPKRKFPNQGPYMGLEKNNNRSAATLSQKRERASSERFFVWGCKGNPLRLFASWLSLEKARIPAPDRGGGTTWQGLTCAGPRGRACRPRTTEGQGSHLWAAVPQAGIELHIQHFPVLHRVLSESALQLEPSLLQHPAGGEVSGKGPWHRSAAGSVWAKAHWQAASTAQVMIPRPQ